MTLDLPSADHTWLPGSPLQLVVCQVRFDVPSGLDSRIARDFYGEIGGSEGRYSKIEQFQTGTWSLTMAGGVAPSVAAPQVGIGWRFTSSDGKWVVSLQPDQVTLETTAYRTWLDDFAVRLSEVLDAVSQRLDPGFEQRLGLRFIDRITGLGIEKPAGWKPYIAPDLLGLVLHEKIGDHVSAARQQLVLELGDSLKCNFGHGFLPSETEQLETSYLLDFDLFREGGRLFDAEDIKRTADRLDDLALQLFYASVTPELIEHFKEGPE